MTAKRSDAPAPRRPAGAPRLPGLVVAALAALMPLAGFAQAPAATTARAPAGADPVMLNFVNADLEAAVRAIGQYTGRQFVIDPRVRGTLTLVTERPVTKQQAYEQLLAALRLQGFTTVEPARPDGIVRIVPEADAKLQGGRVVAPTTPTPRGDQVLTQVFRLRYESATNLVPVLRPLIAPNNTISAYPANNTLVITDYAENLRRIGRIIEAIDGPGAAESEMVQLKHGLAVEVATIANRVLDEGARAAGQATDSGQRVQILAEPRTNSLILRAASPARLALARQLIERLDQPSLSAGDINVVYLRNAEATKLAPLLRAVLANDPTFVPATGGRALSGTTVTSGQQQGAIGQQMQGQQPAQPAPATAAAAGGAGGLAGMIQPDAATNSLIITAPEPLYRNIRSIIEKLDVRRAQVVIESLIVEVQADKAAEFGIQWQDLSGLNDTDTRVIGGTNFGGRGTNIIGVATDPSSVGLGLNIGVVKGKINIPGIGEITNLGFLARALETKANANVLSQPNIQTLDNEEAKFLVGQNVPFVTGSYTQQGSAAVNPFQTYERQDIGLQLRVKPQISEGGVVRLALYLESSSVAPSSLIAGQIITNKRSFESVVLVEDGNFVVLTGLIEDRTNTSTQKVPLLGDIPFLGALFRYENRDRNRTNLMVFLRPIIVRDESTSAALAAERYEYMRAQVAGTQVPESLIFRDLNVPTMPPTPEPKTPAPPAAPAPAQPLTPPAAPPPAPSASETRPAPGTAPPALPPGASEADARAAAAPASPARLLQVTTMPDSASARRVQQFLRVEGFDAYVEPVRTSTGEIYRVRVAVDTSRRTLADATAELKRLGYSPMPVQR
ncbi:MAG: type II secretion system secretin GspD [Burkholderiales bacterium]|nr:MAG: type II secretion system secretin GspD [Burkholderiales bacterium]